MTKTNLITGFLGSGKTTTIRHLLAHKPDQERWAVLVNEFGEIGIDGALLADSGAVLKEIPGGCMCCVNGLPMQVGLNMLLQQAKPDRLLIEPTGLGHPKQILSLLTQESYVGWIDLQATLCLLDARQLSQPRYRDNENFRDQLAAADVILASKTIPISRKTGGRWKPGGRKIRCSGPATPSRKAKRMSRCCPSRARIVQNYRTRSIIMVRRKRGAGGAAIAGARPLAASAERGARLHQLRLDF